MSLSFLSACRLRATDASCHHDEVCDTLSVHLPFLAFGPAASVAPSSVASTLRVSDARSSPLRPFDVHRDGFTIVEKGARAAAALPVVDDPHDRAAVVNTAYAAISRAVEAALTTSRPGARLHAVTYSHMHRYTLQCPSFTVHNDYTNPRQGVKQAQKTLACCPSECEVALSLPFFVVNVWTPLAAVRRDPLAVCRWNGRRGLEDMAYPSPKPGADDWYWMSDMDAGDAIIFKQFDSCSLPATAESPQPHADLARERAAYTLHTSFHHPQLEAAQPPPPPRRSIEYRVLVVEDAQGVLRSDFAPAAMAEIGATAARAAVERAAKAKQKGATLEVARETTGMRKGTA